MKQPAFDPEKDNPGPLNLAIAGENTATKGRVVVFGNSVFATNDGFDAYGNGNMFINSVDWAAEQEDLINITPRTQTLRTFIPPTNIGFIIMIIRGCIRLAWHWWYLLVSPPGLHAAREVRKWLVKQQAQQKQHRARKASTATQRSAQQQHSVPNQQKPVFRAGTWIAVLLLIALIGFTFYLNREKEKPQQMQHQRMERTHTVFAAADGIVSSIEIKPADGEAVKVARNAEKCSGRWNCPSKPKQIRAWLKRRQRKYLLYRFSVK